MLGVIVQHSIEMVTFISWLPALYQPQIRHLIRLVDALLVCDSQKMLTNLYRQLAANHLSPGSRSGGVPHLHFPRASTPSASVQVAVFRF